jgi:hypothetical protein
VPALGAALNGNLARVSRGLQGSSSDRTSLTLNSRCQLDNRRSSDAR